MRTTVDIPDSLYQAAKIKAVQKGGTLKEIVIQALRHDLEKNQGVCEPENPYWGNRDLSPGMKDQLSAGQNEPGQTSTHLLSEERDSRDASLL
jgi:hypothetical protein